ncbi:tetratricopeptide repeat protein [Streptomyces sp. CA-294286]|uniref:tetratricopeptide repeat protein n=1 Tax=Streptomyces sp. CA-294286 TaxID=3240070 RepID=UPI003D8CF758
MDPISLAGITVALSAVVSGAGGEAGKAVFQSAGNLVRRALGREVAAPAGQEQLDALARQLHGILRRDPALAGDWAAFASTVQRGGGVRNVPRLPAATHAFTNRQKVLGLLDAEASRRSDGRPRVVLLHGPEGIGTSEAAKYWGNREADRFRDGQIHVDLRSGPQGALGPRAALREMFRQLGVPDAEIPASEEHRAEYFRSCVADLDLLVVLDHATSLAQVRPLIAPAPRTVTVVVARNPLHGLAALRVPVGPLADKDARRLLVGVAGQPAVDAARAVLPAILARCAGSPYALRAAAPRLAHVPPPRTERTPGPAMSANPRHPEGGDAVRTAVEDSYRSLDPVSARVLRLTALAPWPGCCARIAGWAANLPVDEAGRALETLAALGLLDTTADGRYRHRPAVRVHAEQAALREDGWAVCAQAMSRALRGLLHFAEPTAHAALPQSWRSPRRADTDEASGYPDPGEALGALAAEAGNLAVAIAAADEMGDPDTVCRLVRTLWPVQLKAGHLDTLLPALHTGARTADAHVPGTRTAGLMHAHLGFALTALERYEEAESELRAAARDEQAAGHVRGHASAVEGLGLLRLAQWQRSRVQEAYELFDEAYALYATIDPDDEDAADLPRALALLERHRGRALTGLDRLDEARERLGAALRSFRTDSDAYNTARTLTDLARTHVDGTRAASEADRAAALPLIDEATALLTGEHADQHLAYLRSLRALCVSPPPRPSA